MAIQVQRQTPPPLTGEFPRAGQASALRQPRSAWGWGKRIKRTEMNYFLSQLSLMLEVHTPLSIALSALAAQTSNPTFRAVIYALEKDLEGGRQLSQAMARYPAHFDPVMTSLIEAGERGGYLKETLDRMVEMGEKKEAMIAAIRSALTYPALLFVLAALVMVFIITGVLPKFLVFFAGKEEILPVTTRGLLALSAFLREKWWLCLLGIGALTMGLRAVLRSDWGRRSLDRFTLRTPLVGKMANKVLMVQMFRTLGHLLESHVPLTEALEVVRKGMRSGVYRDLAADIVEGIRQGGRFGQVLAGSGFIPPSVKEMISVGEEAGSLDPVLIRISSHYEKEIDRELKVIASLIEPITLIVLGTAVGVIVASVVLPLFKLVHTIQ